MGRHPLVAACAACALIVFCVAPIVMLFAAAGADAGIALDSRQQRLLLTSTLIAAAAALAATLIGAPLGLLLARAQRRPRITVRLLLLAPLAIPPYVLALAFTSMAGLGRVHQSPAAVALILALAYFGVPMLAVEAALARVPPSSEDAGLLFVGRLRTFARISVPLAAPGAAAGALLVFVLALSEFGVPAYLQVPAYQAEIFTAFASFYDFGRAVRLAVPVVGVAVIAAVLASTTVGRVWLTSPRVAGRPGLLLARSERAALTGWFLLVVIFAVVVPVLSLGVAAFGSRGIQPVVEASYGPIANSLIVSTIAATLIALFAIPIGYIRGRGTSHRWVIADALLLTFFAVPPTVLGVGLIALWNRDVPGPDIYNSPAMLVIACIGRLLPLGALALAVAIRQVPASHEEAAAVSGASWLRATHVILWPQIRPWVVATWVIAFILSFEELGASVLVVPAGFDTLPIHIYTMVANAPSGHLATLALLEACVAVVSLAALALVAKWSAR